MQTWSVEFDIRFLTYPETGMELIVERQIYALEFCNEI